MEDNGNLSKFVDQFNDNPANGAALVRKSAISIEKQYGTVWLGLQVIGVLPAFTSFQFRGRTLRARFTNF